MKTTISIPDDIFQKIEKIARQTRRSRSEVFIEALREYVARNAPDEVTEALNRTCEEVERTGEFVAAASRRVLENVEW